MPGKQEVVIGTKRYLAIFVPHSAASWIIYADIISACFTPVQPRKKSSCMGGFFMDSNKIKEAVKLFLEGIGEDPQREGLLETPDRVARMCEEIYGGLDSDASEHLSKQF